MVHLRRAGLVADKEDVERLRVQFANAHVVRLPALLEPQLLSQALYLIERGNWRERERAGFYRESVLDTGPAVNLLRFVSNSPKFLEVIGEITATHPLTWFDGRVYRMKPSGDHTQNWHEDSIEGRLIGLSLNLSPRGYAGGLFQMRDAKSHRMLLEIANTGLGDAFLFRVSDDFQHHVTDVLPDEPKTAYAGWFSAQKSLKQRLSKPIDQSAPPLA
jgi:hypothetical protein